MDLRQIKVDSDDFGLMSYDPAFTNTASCRSSVTYIDGEKGILRYRGYPVDQLAEKASYLEVAYLLLNGELPNSGQLEIFSHDVTTHTFVHGNVRTFIDGFRYDAHPMGMLVRYGWRSEHLLPGSQAGSRSGNPPCSNGAPDRKDADASRVELPPAIGACHSSTLTTSSATRQISST